MVKLKVVLKIITPVIINSGETYDLFEYSPLNRSFDVKNTLDLFLTEFSQVNLSSIPMSLKELGISDPVNTICSAISKNDYRMLIEIRNKIKETNISKSFCNGYVLPLAKKDLYNKPLLEIQKIMTNQYDSRAYIPGSSIKGAIRTALIEDLRKKYPQTNERYMNKSLFKDTSNFENYVLTGSVNSKINEDIFKYFKVSDFMCLKTNGIKIIGKIENSNKIPVYTEMTNSELLADKEIKALGIICIEDEFFNRLYPNKSYHTIFTKVDNFYADNFNENEPVKNFLKSHRAFCNELTTALNKSSNDGYFIRLGHYTGIVNHTLNMDNPNPPKGKRSSINIDGGKISCIEGGIIPGICIMQVSEM